MAISMFLAAVLVGASLAPAGGAADIIRFEPVPLYRDKPQQREYGALTLLGGWRLRSGSPHMGGLSAMYRTPDGTFVALSDAGILLSFSFDGSQAQSALRVRPLPGIFSADNPQPDRDSESLAHDRETGALWVGFESSNAIRRFSPGFGKKEAWVQPKAMREWPHNRGAEAFVRLADGRFLVVSEGAEGPGNSREAVLFPGDPIDHADQATRFHVKAPRGFEMTDAAQLPDGRILLLNRHFSVLDGVSAALTIMDPADIRAGALIEPRLVQKLAPPLNIDNMEALVVEQDDAHGTVIWIASDDNFNPLQQTLLYRFRLDTARLP